ELGVVCSLSFVFFFFFQAEDGIRDLTVTGVQTCALPISDVYAQLLTVLEPIPLQLNQVLYEPEEPLQHVYFLRSGMVSIVRLMRSEERRVGKECRCRGWASR